MEEKGEPQRMVACLGPACAAGAVEDDNVSSFAIRYRLRRLRRMVHPGVLPAHSSTFSSPHPPYVINT